MFKKKNRSRAQTVVEMALILPVVLLVIFGVIEFGRALFIYTVISNAAREGVRAGLVAPTDDAWIQQRIYARLVLMRPEDVTIAKQCDNGNDGQYITCDIETIVPGRSRIVVGISAPFRMITPILQSIFPPTTIQFESARTIVAGTRAHKTPGVPPPPPPPPQSLKVEFVAGYPCRGLETDPTGHIRVKAKVTDASTGSPVTDATVTLDLEGATLQHLGGGVYGGSSGDCWESSGDTYGDRDVTVTASKTGWGSDSDIQNTTGNVCNGGCVGAPPPPEELHIQFDPGYPCRKANPNQPVRVKAYVYDALGAPVSGATVRVEINTVSWWLTEIPGSPGHYGAGTACWESPNKYNTDQIVKIEATKGILSDNITVSTAGKECSGCLP